MYSITNPKKNPYWCARVYESGCVVFNIIQRFVCTLVYIWQNIDDIILAYEVDNG